MNKEQTTKNALNETKPVLAEYLSFQCCQVIALFMGWNIDEIKMYLIGRNGHMGKLAFNESWDYLMPVIEKIESLPTNKEKGEQYQFSITGDGISITKFDDGSGVVVQKPNEIGKSKLQSTFEVVSIFCCGYLKIPISL